MLQFNGLDEFALSATGFKNRLQNSKINAQKLKYTKKT